MVVTESKRPEGLPDLIQSSDEGDRPSITGTDGTVARFEMAYSPEPGDRFVFGPPLWQRAPSLVYLGFALAVAAVVLTAYYGSSTSRLAVFIVEGDRNRPVGSVPLAFLIVLSAVGTAVRAGMRGVIVTRDGIESRTLLALGVPRVRKWTWVQIDRFIFDGEEVMLELWDGTYERLPRVRESERLTRMLEGIAVARKRQVTHLDALPR